jgi:hypothetical protein
MNRLFTVCEEVRVPSIRKERRVGPNLLFKGAYQNCLIPPPSLRPGDLSRVKE